MKYKKEVSLGVLFMCQVHYIDCSMVIPFSYNNNITAIMFITADAPQKINVWVEILNINSKFRGGKKHKNLIRDEQRCEGKKLRCIILSKQIEICVKKMLIRTSHPGHYENYNWMNNIPEITRT